MTKSIFMKNDKGEWASYSPEELLAQNRCMWKGWTCGAGVLKIHINADGTVYNGVCRVGGARGNIYEGDIDLPSDWITCTKNVCACGDDMMVRKVKAPADKAKAYNYGRTKKDDIENESVVAPYHLQFHNKVDKSVTWEFSRRCNYYCSYCPPNVSNTYEEHRDWPTLKLAADTIINEFGKGDKIKFVINGGEPTINSQYMQLICYLYDKGHVLHTTTNGSKSPEYYATLMRYSSIAFSVHFAFMKNEHVIDVMKAVKEVKDSKLDFAHHNWFGVRPMVQPGNIDKAKELKRMMYNTFGKDVEDWCHINFSPLFTAADESFLMAYDKDELEEINKNA